jgi:hypothetical protein
VIDVILARVAEVSLAEVRRNVVNSVASVSARSYSCVPVADRPRRCPAFRAIPLRPHRDNHVTEENVIACSPLTPTDSICWRGQPLTADIGGQTVALSADCTIYCGFDDIASDVWRRLERPVLVATLCEDLSRSYAGAPVTITRDVVALLEQLREQGLIEIRPKTTDRAESLVDG